MDLTKKDYGKGIIMNILFETKKHLIELYAIRNNPFKEELPLDEIYGDRIPKLIIDEGE